jgi:hypothetical protein
VPNGKLWIRRDEGVQPFAGPLFLEWVTAFICNEVRPQLFLWPVQSAQLSKDAVRVDSGPTKQEVVLVSMY